MYELCFKKQTTFLTTQEYRIEEGREVGGSCNLCANNFYNSKTYVIAVLLCFITLKAFVNLVVPTAQDPVTTFLRKRTERKVISPTSIRYSRGAGFSDTNDKSYIECYRTSLKSCCLT